MGKNARELGLVAFLALHIDFESQGLDLIAQFLGIEFGSLSLDQSNQR